MRSRPSAGISGGDIGARLKSRVSEGLDQVGVGTIAPVDYESFYRQRGSYQSLPVAANRDVRVSLGYDGLVAGDAFSRMILGRCGD